MQNNAKLSYFKEKELQEIHNDIKQTLKQFNVDELTGLALAVTLRNGSVITTWTEALNYPQLIGAVVILQTRMVDNREIT